MIESASMPWKEIEKSFLTAGWELADPALRCLLVGNAAKLWMLAYEPDGGTDDPVFEPVNGEPARRTGSA